jgi:hypothetical protein
VQSLEALETDLKDLIHMLGASDLAD